MPAALTLTWKRSTAKLETLTALTLPGSTTTLQIRRVVEAYFPGWLRSSGVKLSPVTRNERGKTMVCF